MHSASCACLAPHDRRGPVASCLLLSTASKIRTAGSRNDRRSLLYLGSGWQILPASAGARLVDHGARCNSTQRRGPGMFGRGTLSARPSRHKDRPRTALTFCCGRRGRGRSRRPARPVFQIFLFSSASTLSKLLVYTAAIPAWWLADRVPRPGRRPPAFASSRLSASDMTWVYVAWPSAMLLLLHRRALARCGRAMRLSMACSSSRSPQRTAVIQWNGGMGSTSNG